MVAYRFSIQLNDSYAFHEAPDLTEYQKLHQALLPDMTGDTQPEVQRCPACGEMLNKWDVPLTDLRLKRRRSDISATYDGVKTVSQRFRDVCETEGLTGLRFISLPKDKAFYAIRPIRAVRFDAVRRQTEFLNRCDVCGRYRSVVGATPVCLKAGESIHPKEFVWTDLEFASGDEKHPLLLCGVEAGQILKRAKLRGLDIEPIKDAHAAPAPVRFDWYSSRRPATTSLNIPILSDGLPEEMNIVANLEWHIERTLR